MVCAVHVVCVVVLWRGPRVPKQPSNSINFPLNESLGNTTQARALLCVPAKAMRVYTDGIRLIN